MTAGDGAVGRGGRPPSRQPTARALFYSHDDSGLGHVRTNLAIVWELSRRLPDAALVAVHDASRVRSFPVPANFDDVQLPPLAQRALFQDLPAPRGNGAVRLPSGTERGVHVLREAIATATVRAYAPHVVLVDHLPAGAGGELVQALRLLDAASPRPFLAVGLSDVDDAPERISRWQQDGSHELLDTVYDAILVYVDGQILDPVAGYGLSPAAAAKVILCGYLPPDPPAESPEAVRERLGVGDAPLLVCNASDGEDGAESIQTILQALRRPELVGIRAFVVAGPLLAAADVAALAAETAAVPGATLVPADENVASYVNAADVVVLMGSISAVREAIGLGKRPVIVPRPSPTFEQLVRAQRLTELGLATWVHPGEATSDSLARAIRAELDAGFSPPPLLDFGGLRRAGDVLARAISFQPSAISIRRRRRHRPWSGHVQEDGRSRADS